MQLSIVNDNKISSQSIIPNSFVNLNNININSVKTVNATVRPSLTISKEVVIKEGLGTKNNPYEIILP